MKNSNKIYTSLHRGLHWIMAILMTVLFITGFLRMYWMSKRSILSAIEKNMQGVSLTKEQSIGTVKTIIHPMWEWHEYAAYVFFVAIAVRIVYMLAKGIRFPNPFASGIAVKERLQGFTYLLFYLFVIVSSITGAYLKWGDGSLKEPMEAVHKWAIYWFPVFVILHFGGIWLAEKGVKKGIASKMIGGDD
ncbi:MAG: cytochrome b/b6 domain-containing protein [Flavobacteriia bacterium]|nr:cytochrome b/b6 domain-containing protein [Flavobacteriia bacterium]OJX35990.1 MAG: cytochrome B [Flavobacteriia bacterium 40-80]